MTMTTVVEVFAHGRLVETYDLASADAEDVRRFLNAENSQGLLYDWHEARAYEGGPDACNGEPSFVLTREVEE